MGRKKKSNFLVSAHRTLRKKSVVAAVYIVLRLLVILVMVAQFFNGNFENVFLCILTLILFLLPTIFEKSLQIDLPRIHGHRGLLLLHDHRRAVGIF